MFIFKVPLVVSAGFWLACFVTCTDVMCHGPYRSSSADIQILLGPRNCQMDSPVPICLTQPLLLLGPYIYTGLSMFHITNNITEFDKIVFGGCLVYPIIQYWTCLFFKNSNIFRHLELEIALAIPAPNDEKYNCSNSAGQGLMHWGICM